VEDPEAQPALRVPERLIGAPHSISAEARAVLARAAQTPFQWPPHPDPHDIEGWVRYAEGANANMRMMIQALPEPGDDEPFEATRLGLFDCFRCEGAGKGATPSRRVLFQVHGGALIAGGGDLCRIMASRAAHRLDAIVYAPDYRLPPRFPFPAALDDCLAAYHHVLGLHEPGQIVVLGSSAGGNLAAALMLRAKAQGLPLPAGLVLETPQLDLTESGDSFQTNEVIDVVLQHGLGPVNRLYANGYDLANPLLSPLFGDFSEGWPPTLLTAGTRDLFLSNAVRMLHGLRDAGADVELLVYEAMPHGGFFGTSEDRRVRSDVRNFANACWSA
jgi:monoterpene epsilon-lactone hydrolase